MGTAATLAACTLSPGERDELQLAFVDGTATAAQRAHAKTCPGECAFFAALAPSQSAAAPFALSPLGQFEELLQETMQEKKPFLGRYRLLERLSEGGQGVVYRAEEEGAGEVALKFVRARLPGTATR